MKPSRIRRFVKIEVPNVYLGSGTLEVKKNGISFVSSITKKKFYWSWENLINNCECKSCTIAREENMDGNLEAFEIE